MCADPIVPLIDGKAIHTLPCIAKGLLFQHLFHYIQIVLQCPDPRFPHPVIGRPLEHSYRLPIPLTRRPHRHRHKAYPLPIAQTVRCILQRRFVCVPLKERRKVTPVRIQRKQKSSIHVQLCLVQILELYQIRHCTGSHVLSQLIFCLLSPGIEFHCDPCIFVQG